MLNILAFTFTFTYLVFKERLFFYFQKLLTFELSYDQIVVTVFPVFPKNRLRFLDKIWNFMANIAKYCQARFLKGNFIDVTKKTVFMSAVCVHRNQDPLDENKSQQY